MRPLWPLWLCAVTVWLIARNTVAKSPCKCGCVGGIYSAAISSWELSIADCKFSIISAARTSGSGKLSKSARDLSLIQKISRLVLSRFRMSSIERSLHQTVLPSRLFQCADILILRFCTFVGVHILPGIPDRDTGLFFYGTYSSDMISIEYTIIPDGVT